MSASHNSHLSRGVKATFSALAAPDATELITEGDWAGFTRGQAIAWNWNLFDYEPKGFISPGSILRAQSISKLLNGDIPEVFGYADRARQFESEGVTASAYRSAKEATGAKVFDPKDVVFR